LQPRRGLYFAWKLIILAYWKITAFIYCNYEISLITYSESVLKSG
jgi:hypothetical protein